VMMMKSEVKEIENGVGVGCIVDAFSLSRERERRGGERMCEMYRYGRHTAPTPSTFFLQQFGLACTKAFAIHLRRKPSNATRPHPSPPGPNRTPPGLSNPYSTTPSGI